MHPILIIIFLLLATFPSPQHSSLISTDAPTKLRIESFTKLPGIDLCLAWLHGTGNISTSRFSYEVSLSPVPTTIANPLPNVASFVDVDVVDGATDCNIVGLDVSVNILILYTFYFIFRSLSFLNNGFFDCKAMRYYIAGTNYSEVEQPNSVAIGVSRVDSGFKAIIRDNTDAMPPFSDGFAGDIETRRMSGKRCAPKIESPFGTRFNLFSFYSLATSYLVATALKSSRLFIGKVMTTGGFTVLANLSTTVQPTSISAAVYSETNWVVCAIVTVSAARIY
jgi:hypothetical protein